MTHEQSTGTLTRELLAELSGGNGSPCLSLYMPTHRTHPDNQQDPIRFKNLVTQLEASLQQSYPDVDAHSLLTPFRALADDRELWEHALDGLAAFGCPGFFRAHRIPQPVAELTVAADSFHTKPLRRLLQSVEQYQILGLSLHGIQMYEGNRHALDELELLPGVPRTITDALGDELTEPHLHVASHRGVAGESSPSHHGHGGKADEVAIDADRFFRAVDRAVMEHFSKPSGLPLLLAALPEHHHRFHAISQNPALVASGIRFNPESVSTDKLRALAWDVMEPEHNATLSAFCEAYEQAESQGLGSDVMVDVAVAATAGRVATLLIEADREIAGSIDAATGRVQLAGPGHMNVDDLLDDLGELVASMGGIVQVIPAAIIPSRTGIAATYRY
jgi:hypothetical protein